MYNMFTLLNPFWIEIHTRPEHIVPQTVSSQYQQQQ
jgi:hypothetical protein